MPNPEPPPKLHVGQKLWFEPYRRFRNACEVEVEKIGRKWATLADQKGRINKETLVMDGGEYSLPGRCWLSREECERARETVRLWQNFKRKLDRTSDVPPIAADVIRQAAELLGVKLED